MCATSATRGSATRAAPVDPSPASTCSTPGGRCSATSRPSSHPACGLRSEGLCTTVLPVTSAAASRPAAAGSGSFHGVRTATTPWGSRRTTSSAAGAPASVRPAGPRPVVAASVSRSAATRADSTDVRSSRPVSAVSAAPSLLGVVPDGGGRGGQARRALRRCGAPPGVEGSGGPGDGGGHLVVVRDGHGARRRPVHRGRPRQPPGASRRHRGTVPPVLREGRRRRSTAAGGRRRAGQGVVEGGHLISYPDMPDLWEAVQGAGAGEATHPGWAGDSRTGPPPRTTLAPIGKVGH